MADLEAVVWGYGLLEGPRYDAATDSLYFSDVPNGGVYRLDVQGGGVEVAIPKRKGVGGIALHERGGLVVGGRNVCHVLDGQTRVLFQPASNGLNDLFADSAGNVVFGSLRDDPFAFGTERKAGEGWRITAEGEATELYGGVLLSNGIGLSPDGSVIYHADTASNGVWAHDYQVDGPVSGRRLQIHADDLQPDGLAIDEDGVVWVADVSGSRAVRAFDPQGTEVARIDVPAKMVTSICFGGADRRDVYIVTADNTADPDRGGTVFRTRADVAGTAIPKATI